MIREVRHTRILAVVLAVLVAIDFAIPREREQVDREMPSILAFDAEEARAIAISQGDVEVHLDRGDDGAWQLTAPIEYRADQVLVDGLLAAAGAGVQMDARVDDDNHERYGLDSDRPILVEIEGDGEQLAAFYVGNDAAGGSTFVRFPRAADVYRARVGGRARFERAPRAWRDHQVLSIEAERVAEISVEPAQGEALTFMRPHTLDDAGPPTPGRWRLSEDPGFPVDQPLLGEVAEAFSRLRAGDILSADHPSGLDDPMAEVGLALDDGARFRLQFGRNTGQTYLRHADRPEVYHIGPNLLNLLVSPRLVWRNRAILALDPARIRRMTLEDPTVTSVLELTDGQWRITRPTGVDADHAVAQGAAQRLAGLRVDEFTALSGADTGLPGTSRIVVETDDGRAWTVEIGAPVPNRPEGREAFYARTSHQPEPVGLLNARLLSLLRKAWAR